jgi:hypothetical protein
MNYLWCKANTWLRESPSGRTHLKAPSSSDRMHCNSISQIYLLHPVGDSSMLSADCEYRKTAYGCSSWKESEIHGLRLNTYLRIFLNTKPKIIRIIQYGKD